MPQPRIDEARALDHLMDLLAIEGLSGREGKVAAAVREKLLRAGCEPSWIGHDDANERIPGDYEVGNLIVDLPATRSGPRRLFMGHMDTVPLCRGAVPVRRNGRIEAEGDTALGGDNRTSIGALVTMVETLLAQDVPRPPTTVLMTVGEEVGLWGARTVELDRLGNPEMGFNIDSGAPHVLIVGATGADRWQVDVHGKSSHAGVHPEHGISAALIASRAVADVAATGFFGKIELPAGSGTSNIGRMAGGEASNQVTDHVFVSGESRSHDKAFLAQITAAWRDAFEQAARSVTSSDGQCGRVDFRAETDYEAFEMTKGSPPVQLAAERVRAVLGVEAEYLVANGGLDANYLNAKGLPTVTLGAGQHNPHTVDEYVDVQEYVDGCRTIAAIAAA
ncbi:MAG: M20/M25/M40 family metallo-hydrolase [Acidobacteriota bacterium]|nr:M20/M25/M40 family metallo-hydrolase [Acidobacteriota bacterium]